MKAFQFFLMKQKDNVGAKESLEQALKLRGDIPAAKHMINALSEDESLKIKYSDPEYVRDLYNSYAPSYGKYCFKNYLNIFFYYNLILN